MSIITVMVKHPRIRNFTDMFQAQRSFDPCLGIGNHAHELLHSCAAALHGSESGFAWTDHSGARLDLQRMNVFLMPFIRGLEAAVRALRDGAASVLIPWRQHWILGLGLSATNAAKSPVAFVIFEGKMIPRFDAHMLGVIDGFQCSLATVLSCQQPECGASRTAIENDDLLIVCSYCRQVRSESGEWLLWDLYPKLTGRQKCSHTICETCALLHYSELVLFKSMKEGSLSD